MSGAAVSNPNANASANASASADANINTNFNTNASKPKLNTTVTNVASHQPDEPEILQASTGSLVPVIILISIATLGSYILGLFQFSILWTSIFLLLAYNFMFRRLARLRRYHRNALERDVARQRLERHAESAEWLNFIVERLWGVLEPVISVKVTEKVNAALGDVCPSFLDSLMLTEFTLGSSAPSIITARVHPKTQPDVIHLDAEFSFIPNEADRNAPATNESSLPQWNSKIVLAARVGKGLVGVDIPVMLKEISVFGKIRVQIELSPTTPFIGKLQLAFLEPPQIDFILKPLKSLDIMDLPGLSNWLSSTITDVISEKMVDPNLITIPLKRSYSDVRSVGVLKVSLLEVRGMKLIGNMQPFVKLQIGGKYKAVSTVLDTNSMAWNQVFYILVPSLNNPISFVIMGSPVSMIGSVTYHIGDLELDMAASKNVWRTIVGHESSKIRGELNFGVEYYPAADEPDPEVDLSFESGIVQISLHQIKELWGTDKRTVNCCYEVYVHPNNFKVDWKDPPKLREGNFYKSKIKKKSNNPSWDEVFEVFLEQKDRSSITFLVRHGAKEEVIYARWTAPFSKLLNRTDWFTFDDIEKAQFYASFLFRPIRIDVSTGLDLNFSPCVGIARIQVISGSGFKSGKGGYRVAVDISGRASGKTQTSLVESSPVWNKRILSIAKDSKDIITLDVQNVEKGTSYGHVSVTVAELLAHEGCDIERHSNLTDSEGHALQGKLRFTVGIHPAKNIASPPEAESFEIIGHDFNRSKSNCGVLEIYSITVDGVLPTTVHSLHYVKLAFENCDPFYVTAPAHVGGTGLHTWKKQSEILVQDFDRQDLHFTVMETHGAKDVFVDALSVSMGDLRGNDFYQLEGITQGRLSIRALYRPVELLLDPEVVESGMLQIQIKSASELIAVDSGGTSDPFCVLRLNGNKFFKSRVIKKCLDPVFDETTEVEIKQRDVSVLQVELRDWNKVAASRTLGVINIELQNLPPNQWQDLSLPLENVSSGTLKLRLLFTPEQDGRGHRRSPTENLNVIAVPSPASEAGKESGLPPIPEDENVTDPKITSTVTSATTSAGTSKATSPSLSSSRLASERGSVTNSFSAAGIRVTIVELQLDGQHEAFDCKVKVRSGGHTIFKTRNIRGTEHRWNESFTIDPDVANDLKVLLTWDQHPSDLALNIPRDVDPDGENELSLPLDGLAGQLILKHSMTNDTHHMVDTTHRRRFSFLGK